MTAAATATAFFARHASPRLPYRYLGRQLVRESRTTLEVQAEIVSWSDGVAYQNDKSIHAKVVTVTEGFLLVVGFQQGEKPVAWMPLSLHGSIADASERGKSTLAPYVALDRGTATADDDNDENDYPRYDPDRERFGSDY